MHNICIANKDSQTDALLERLAAASVPDDPTTATIDQDDVGVETETTTTTERQQLERAARKRAHIEDLVIDKYVGN